MVLARLHVGAQGGRGDAGRSREHSVALARTCPDNLWCRTAFSPHPLPNPESPAHSWARPVSHYVPAHHLGPHGHSWHGTCPNRLHVRVGKGVQEEGGQEPQVFWAWLVRCHTVLASSSLHSSPHPPSPQHMAGSGTPTWPEAGHRNTVRHQPVQAVPQRFGVGKDVQGERGSKHSIVLNQGRAII